MNESHPYAEVQQLGPVTYAIWLVDGIVLYNLEGAPWVLLVASRRRVERKARRLLRRHLGCRPDPDDPSWVRWWRR